MALERKSGTAAKNGDGAALTSSVETPSSRDGDDPNVSRPQPSLPDRNPSSSSRVSSMNWAIGEPVNRNISPSAVFGEGVDHIPMPLDGNIFAADNDSETLAFFDTMSGEEVASSDTSRCDGHPDGNAADMSCATSTKVITTGNSKDTNAGRTNLIDDGESIHSDAQKRKAESMGNDTSVANFIQQSDDPAATYNAYVPRPEPCEPNDKDILLGRGGLSNHHIGNIHYRDHIEEFKPYYQRLDTKDEKKELSMVFINFVHNYGGRFLEADDEKDGWLEIQNNKARKKASQALREEKKPRKSR